MDEAINAIIKNLENAKKDISDLTEQYQNLYHISSRISRSIDSIEQAIEHLDIAKDRRYRKG